MATFAVIRGQATENQLVAKRAQIRAICSTAGSRFVRFTFIKQDNSVRELTTCNTATVGLVGDDASPERQQAVAKRAANNPHLLNRYDVHAKGWRSIDLDTVTELRVDGVTTSFVDGPWRHTEGIWYYTEGSWHRVDVDCPATTTEGG